MEKERQKELQRKYLGMELDDHEEDETHKKDRRIPRFEDSHPRGGNLS